jgi:catechol 2,3-dioxygenase-like lactoylglutathione lyase family enzyme
VDVLSSRILLRPSDLDRSRRFYRDVLGLAIYREFGSPEDPGEVFFLGPGLLEVSGPAAGPPGRSVMIWIQARDVRAEHVRLAAAGVPVIREPALEPSGLIKMWIEDPTASGSSWSRFPPTTPSAVTRDQGHHQGDAPYAGASTERRSAARLTRAEPLVPGLRLQHGSPRRLQLPPGDSLPYHCAYEPRPLAEAHAGRRL